jgi:DNA-binding transcriptional LysR family regulator
MSSLTGPMSGSLLRDCPAHDRFKHLKPNIATSLMNVAERQNAHWARFLMRHPSSCTFSAIARRPLSDRIRRSPFVPRRAAISRQDSAPRAFGTLMQMVANSYGVTLVPEVAIDVEIRDERVKLLRFVEPQPSRTIGLAWRRTSPRRPDFSNLGKQ